MILKKERHTLTAPIIVTSPSGRICRALKWTIRWIPSIADLNFLFETMDFLKSQCQLSPKIELGTPGVLSHLTGLHNNPFSSFGSSCLLHFSHITALPNILSYRPAYFIFQTSLHCPKFWALSSGENLFKNSCRAISHD